MSALRNRRLAQRHLFYFKIGWSQYMWYVVDFASSITVLYVLLLAGIPEISTVLPDFIRFAIVALVFVFTVSDMLGWLHFHRLGTYSAEQDIAAESSPYTTEMLTLSLLPFMRVVYELGKRNSFELTPSLKVTMKQCETILKRSEERWAKNPMSR